MDGGFHPVVTSISPVDGVSSVSIDTSISVTFSEAMDSSSVSTNTLDTSCIETIQVSSDNFSTCVKMTVSPSVSNTHKTFTVTPSSSLSYSTTYKVRVTTNLWTQWTQTNGFVTSPSWLGNQQLGTSSKDRGYGVTVDNSSNIYVTGYTDGGLDGNTKSFIIRRSPQLISPLFCTR